MKLKFLEKTFPQHDKLSKSAWFLIIYTILQMMMLLWQAFFNGMYGWIITAILKLLLASYAVWAIINILRYRIEGFMQLLLVYGVGLFAGASTSGWAFDFSGLLAVRWYMITPQYQYGETAPIGHSMFAINLLVILFWWLSARNILKLKKET